MPPERSLGTTVAEQVFEARHRRADTRTTYSGVMDEVEARRRLRAERADVAARLRDLGVSFEDIVDAARDSNLDDEHDPEGTTIAAERSLVSSLARSSERHLAEVDAALERLAAGTYGRCVRCGGPIAADRLDARPSTPVCIGCASSS